jgi:hypothetical protein
MLRFYTPASTANPTGIRPWNSRLSFYEPNAYAVPTAGRGPFLLQPGITGRPMANGAMGYYERANFVVPTHGLSGLGQTEIAGLTVDPMLLGLGAIALLGAFYLFGSGRPRRKARRLRSKISRSQRKLQELAV